MQREGEVTSPKSPLIHATPGTGVHFHLTLEALPLCNAALYFGGSPSNGWLRGTTQSCRNIKSEGKLVFSDGGVPNDAIWDAWVSFGEEQAANRTQYHAVGEVSCLLHSADLKASFSVHVLLKLMPKRLGGRNKGLAKLLT